MLTHVTVNSVEIWGSSSTATASSRSSTILSVSEDEALANLSKAPSSKAELAFNSAISFSIALANRRPLLYLILKI